MDIEAQELLDDFLFHMDSFRYPQTVVCDTVVASLSDLNEWRRRGILPESGYKKQGRIIYTGAMLMRAGFLAELAPIIGPSDANHFADIFLSSRPFDLTGINGKVVLFGPRRFERFDLMLVNAGEGMEPIGRAKIVFPIGRLIPQWMVGAELRMMHPESMEFSK